MTNNEKKKSFWTSLPGILTGMAAVITAVSGLFFAIGYNSELSSSNIAVLPPPAVPKTSLPIEWPLVVEETFSEIPSRWTMGSYPSGDLVRFDLSIVGGKYRWDMEFQNAVERPIKAPYGPETDFYMAVDVKFVALGSGEITASILFGRASNKEYGLYISSYQKFALSRYDGKNNVLIIDWTPISINLNESNRIAVAVEDQQIQLYLNSKLLGKYKDFAYTGGKVGLAVTSYQPNATTVVDFDNLELRRKP